MQRVQQRSSDVSRIRLQDQLLNSTHRTYMPLMHQKVASQGLQLRSFAVSSTGAYCSALGQANNGCSRVCVGRRSYPRFTSVGCGKRMGLMRVPSVCSMLPIKSQLLDRALLSQHKRELLVRRWLQLQCYKDTIHSTGSQGGRHSKLESVSSRCATLPRR